MDLTDAGMFPVVNSSCHVVAYRRAEPDGRMLYKLLIRNVIWYLFDQLNSIEGIRKEIDRVVNFGTFTGLFIRNLPISDERPGLTLVKSRSAANTRPKGFGRTAA